MSTQQTINSDSKIKVLGTQTTIQAGGYVYSLQYPNLQMFRSDTPLVEVGTISNPLDFGFCPAGQSTDLAYDILLFNDRDGSIGSQDAFDILVTLEEMDMTESFTSTGLSHQTFTCSFNPIDSILVTVNGVRWNPVSDLSGYGQYALIYTVDMSSGLVSFGDSVHGLIPPVGSTITLDYTPVLDTFGSKVYQQNWLSVRSTGVIVHEITVTSELPTILSSTSIRVLHKPVITSVVGVWDNPAKTGTNYYTGGSFNDSTGIITLGTPLPGSDAYADYKYQIKNDAEGGFTTLGIGLSHLFAYSIPSQNAKILQLRMTVPATANTNGGANIRIRLKLDYSY